MMRNTGFTLIEVMVALVIFALLAALGYRGLDAVLGAEAHVRDEARTWRTLAVAFASIDEALGAAIDMPVRDRDGAVAAPFSGSAARRRDDEPLLVFTRLGFAGYAGALADAQRVGLRLSGGRIEQLVWPVLHAAPRTEPRAFTLADGIARVDLRYLSRDGAWHAAWPPAGKHAALPAAVELKLRLATGEEVSRFFALP